MYQPKIVLPCVRSFILLLIKKTKDEKKKSSDLSTKIVFHEETFLIKLDEIREGNNLFPFSLRKSSCPPLLHIAMCQCSIVENPK